MNMRHERRKLKIADVFLFVFHVNFQILEALESDAGCRKLHLAHRLENVACTLEGEETSAC